MILTPKEKQILAAIQSVAGTGDVGLLKTILDYKPEEYLDVIKKTRIDSFSFDRNMLTCLLEYGFQMNGQEIVGMINLYGFEISKHLLQYREKNLENRGEMIYAFYDDSKEALEWLRDSDISNVFVRTSRLLWFTINHPDVDRFAIFFSPSSHSDRWWSTIYQDFPLDNLVNLRGRNDLPPLDRVIRKERISGIVDLFFRNMKTPEEYEIMSRFSDAHPEYELPERSFQP